MPRLSARGDERIRRKSHRRRDGVISGLAPQLRGPGAVETDMTSNRARAYGRVMSLIEELGPAKLHADEQQAIRDAADAALFTYDIAADSTARDAIINLDRVMDRLVDNGRVP